MVEEIKSRGSFSRGLGVRDAIGVSVAGMGPTLAMNLNPQEPAKHVGALVPMVFAISCLLLVMVAWCFARLARRHPNAGSAYGFVSAVMGPRMGIVAGWALIGTYLSFGVVGISGFGLFRSDIAERFHPMHHPGTFFFTLTGALAVTFLCITATRLAAGALIVIEGVAVAAMLALSSVVLWRVLHGHGPQGDPVPWDLLIPRPGLSLSSLALALSFGFLSFAGFEEVAAMGEEVKRPSVTIPRVLMGTILGGGAVYVTVSAAEVLGFGTDPAGMARFTSSVSLLGDLGRMVSGPWCGDLLDILAIGSALGCGLASVMAASRILFAMSRDLAPGSRMARLSGSGETPVHASLLIIATIVTGYLAMRLVFHARGSDPFFWASTLGALGLLVVYFLVVLSAGVTVVREARGAGLFQVLVPAVAALSIGYTLFVNVWPVQSGAYGVIPWVVASWCLLPLFSEMFAKHPSQRP